MKLYKEVENWEYAFSFRVNFFWKYAAIFPVCSTNAAIILAERYQRLHNDKDRRWSLKRSG